MQRTMFLTRRRVSAVERGVSVRSALSELARRRVAAGREDRESAREFLAPGRLRSLLVMGWRGGPGRFALAWWGIRS
jgi:hypothetical protein